MTRRTLTKIDFEDILALSGEMAGIAADIARDPEEPSSIRISAAVAAGRIAVTAAPVIELRAKMEAHALRRAGDILEANAFVQAQPHYMIERIKAESFLTDAARRVGLPVGDDDEGDKPKLPKW